MSPTSYRTAPPRAKLYSFPKTSNDRKINDFKSAIRNPQSQMPLVGLGRVELPTSRLSGVRSNQLSYRPLVLFRDILTRNAPILTQKRSTLLFLVVRISVDAPEGRVASVAKYCLRSTLLPNCKRSKKPKNSISEH